MIRPTLILLFGFLSTWAQAEVSTHIKRWERHGVEFEVEMNHFQRQQKLFLSSSTQIAGLITDILSGHVPEKVKKAFSVRPLLVLYQKSSQADAMFFPPGTFRKGPKEEWIILINPALIHQTDYLRIIAHEFFHALHHNMNPHELDWVREGLAQLFEHQLFGGMNQTHVVSSLTRSDFPLEDSFDVNDYRPEKYGNTFLYFHYLRSQCQPQDDFVWSFVMSGKNGREGIDVTLAGLNSDSTVCDGFTSSARAFSVARMVNAYSGNTQSPVTYLLPFSLKLEVNTASEKKILANPKSFWQSMRPFRPQKLSQETALKLTKTAPQNASWWGLETNYPFRTRAISPAEISSLPPHWDIGLFTTH